VSQSGAFFCYILGGAVEYDLYFTCRVLHAGLSFKRRTVQSQLANIYTNGALKTILPVSPL